jgi:hypothetical protein
MDIETLRIFCHDTFAMMWQIFPLKNPLWSISVKMYVRYRKLEIKKEIPKEIPESQNKK